jgi:hypothetical protein
MAFRIGVKFDATGWEARGLHGNVLVWHNEHGDGLGLYQFDVVPDLPAPLEEESKLLESWPLDAMSGVISREVITLDGLLSVRAITKHRQTPSGLTYIGSWIIPRANFSYVIKIQCQEHGTTGLREAVVGNRALQDGAITLNDNGDMIGWLLNPHVATSEPWWHTNLSEGAMFDAEFPDHPLSRLRRSMRTLEPSVRIERFVKSAPPFTGPRVKQGFWKRLLG